VRIRHLLVLAAAALFVAFGPPERTTPEKWALVIGISDYMHFGDEIGGDLPGAANDARSMADVLVNRYDFDPDNVRLVLDHDATRARMVAELTEWLPSVARPGDLIWFYFAGHGSQAWDRNRDEPDGLDETTCPADAMRGNTENDILDDEMALWLSQLPTDNVIVVWDKCHAKSSTRAVTPFARPRSLDRNVQEDVAPPLGVAVDLDDPAPVEEPEDGGPPDPGVLEISASQADEVALDAAFPNREGRGHTFGGAFTTPFVRNLWNAPSGTSYEDILEQTRTDMKRNRFRQQPSIDQKELKDRPIFWIAGAQSADDVESPQVALAEGARPQVQEHRPDRVEALRPRPEGEEEGEEAGEPAEQPAAAGATMPLSGAAVRVAAVEDETVVFSGGGNAGVTVGSIYRVGGDLLEVTAVDPERAYARKVARGTRGIGVVQAAEVGPGVRAELVAYRYPDAELRVQIADLDAGTRRALKRELRRVPSLQLLEDGGSFSHLIVRTRGDHDVVLNLDGFPRDSVRAGDSDALAELLRREFGQFQLTELENPAHPFELIFGFGTGRSDLVLGENVSFRMQSDRAGYLTIIDLAPDGTVAVIFPNQFVEDNYVPARTVVEFPSPEMNLRFPVIEPIGRGVVRAFLTERPLEVPFGAQAEAAEAEQIWAALRDAAGNPPVSGSEAIPVQNWTSEAIVYEIRRP
jgi:hypothetical protein